MKWRNSPKVSNHCLNKKPITLESHIDFYEKNVITGYYQQYIVERIEEQYEAASYPIATVYLKDIDRNNHRCELFIFTSDDEEWNTESQAIAIKMLLKKAFEDLNMHKVYSHVFYKFIDEAELLKKQVSPQKLSSKVRRLMKMDIMKMLLDLASLMMAINV